MRTSRMHTKRRETPDSGSPHPSYGSQAPRASWHYGICTNLRLAAPRERERRHAVSWRLPALASVLCGLLAILSGCEGSRQDPRSTLNDVSYANHRGDPCGPNALDVPVALEDFEGSFLWVDYAAPWCASCTRQASVIRAVEASAKDPVVFLTLITSGNEPTEEATAATALSWARQYGLDPAKVVASHERSRTIPQHTFFSPQGQTLYHAIGYHSEAQIRALIARHARTWRRLHPEVSAVD